MSVSRRLAWLAWMIASIFYAYQYVLRVMPSIMLHDISQQFHIDATVFGQFSGVYYIGYSLVHLPIGIMLDRFGPRKIMSGCILLTVIGLLPIIFAEYWVYPIIGRGLVGIGSSAAILGTFKIIRMSFKEKLFPRMLSISVTIGLIGAIYGGGPVSYMCTTLGYQVVIKIFVALGILLACITYLIVPESKPTHQTSIVSNIKSVFSNSKVLMICFFSGLMLGPLEGFADVWGASFLSQVYRFDSITAGSLPSMIFIGMCFGAPLLSLAAEKSGQYIGTIIAAGSIMFLVFAALITGILTKTSITGGFILVGICCAYQILAIYKASTYVTEDLAGLTTAVANMIIMSFGYGFDSVIGYIVNAYGGTQVPQAFIYGVGVIPLTLALGVIGFIFLAYKESTCEKPELRTISESH